MEVLNLRISKSNFNTCKLENRNFWSPMFLLFQIGFCFKAYQWLQDGQWNFSIIKFVGKEFFRMDQKWKKNANLSQICPKMDIHNFCDFDRRCFKQKRF